MRTTALEFVSQGKVGFCELAQPPAPGPRQVLMETCFSGITNGTERHALLVEYGYGAGRFPSRHGYQQVGRIVAVGAEVKTYAKDDWVFFGGYVGHRGWNLIDENDLMVRLPAEINPRLCALLGVAGVALRGVRRMGVSAGHKVWVVGLGPIGQFIAQAARSVGAHVTVSDILPNRLKTAKDCGAHAVLDALAEGFWETLKTGGPYDFIFDCCSLERLLFDIFKHNLLAYSGTIGAMAVRKELTFPWSLLHQNQARIEVSCHFDKDDLRVLLSLCRQGLLNFEPVISHRVPIGEAQAIYALLAARPQDLLGVVFEW